MDLDTVQRWDRTGSYVKGISNTNTTGSNILSVRLVNCEGLILWGFRTSAHSPEDRELTTGLGKAKSQPEILEDEIYMLRNGLGLSFLYCVVVELGRQDIDQMAGVEDRSGASRPPSPILSRVVNQRENNGRLGEFQVSSLFSCWLFGLCLTSALSILRVNSDTFEEYLFDSGISPSNSFF